MQRSNENTSTDEIRQSSSVSDITSKQPSWGSHLRSSKAEAPNIAAAVALDPQQPSTSRSDASLEEESMYQPPDWRKHRATYDTFSGMNLFEVHQLLGDRTTDKEMLHDYSGTTVTTQMGPRNSWEIWKAKLTEEELSHEVANFVVSRVDTLVQEERWRNKMMRRLGDKFDGIDCRLDKINEDLKEIMQNTRRPQGEPTTTTEAEAGAMQI